MFLRFPSALWRNRELVWRLTEREVLGRYRGSFLGIAWSLLNPLAMLGVYTFVFSQVFKARWGNLEESGPIGFAVNLFAGLIVFNFFAECANRAPGVILANSNYVKKVIFPLEILAGVIVGSAMFNALTGLGVLAAFELVGQRHIPLTALWLPFVWLPLITGCLAIAWILSALGVFLRDMGQLIALAVSMLMFLSPIFFPMSALPARWQPLLALNPLAVIIEQTRLVLVDGTHPDLSALAVASVLSILSCELAFRSFCRAKRTFADVM